MRTQYTDSGIYQIKNLLNGKRYVGSAKNLKVRLSKHISALNIGHHHAKHLQCACNKYGLEHFKFSVLLKCAPKDLLFYEQRAFDIMKPEYNSCPAAGNTLGMKCSLETRRKISKAHKGKKLSPEHKAKIVPWGRVITDETRAKLHAIGATRATDEDFKRRCREGCKKRVFPADFGERISRAKKGRKPKLAEEVRLRKNAKIGEANRRRIITAEFRKNASAGQRARRGIEHFKLGEELLTVLEMAERYGINRHTLRKRLNAGWSVEKSAHTPVRSKNGNN